MAEGRRVAIVTGASRGLGLVIAQVLASRRYDIVIGARPIATMRDFSWAKRMLQRAGSWVVRRLSATRVADATSGFRAYSREAALRLDVFSGYTYTLETIVQAANHGLRVVSVPVLDWFLEQDQAYRDEVLPPSVKARVSVEAGLALPWYRLIGDAGEAVSLEHYGASADYKTLYREFGITAEAVADAARRSLTRLKG